ESFRPRSHRGDSAGRSVHGTSARTGSIRYTCRTASYHGRGLIGVDRRRRYTALKPEALDRARRWLDAHRHDRLPGSRARPRRTRWALHRFHDRRRHEGRSVVPTMTMRTTWKELQTGLEVTTGHHYVITVHGPHIDAFGTVDLTFHSESAVVLPAPSGALPNDPQGELSSLAVLA